MSEMPGEMLGTIHIAPEVLVTIAQLTTLSVPGVDRMSHNLASSVSHFLGKKTAHHGVEIYVEDDTVSVDLHIVVKQGVNIVRVSEQVQAEVSRAIDEMVGMTLREVNVFIQDVDLSKAQQVLDEGDEG